MKRIQLVITLALLSTLSQGYTQAKEYNPNDITGFYWSPKKDAKIEIYLKDHKYFGRFVWLAAPRKDVKNPTRSLQSRDVLGLELLSRFSCTNDGIYSGGEIYDPETGKTYSCKMSLEGNRLKVRGYIGVSLFGRTEYFERIK